MISPDQDYFRKSQKLVTDIFPYIGIRSFGSVGPFSYESEVHTVIDFWKNNQEERSNYARLCFDLNLMQLRTPESFSDLVVFLENRRLELGRRSVRDEASIGTIEYPSFDYHWDIIEVDGQRKGVLSYLRTNLAGDIFVFYQKHSDGSWEVFKKGDEDLLREIPEDITRVSTLLKVPVPHVINVDNVAKFVYEASDIEGFRQSILQKYQ